MAENTVKKHNGRASELFSSPEGRKGQVSEPLMFGWKADRRNQFCSDVTWQLSAETGMTALASHFLVAFKTPETTYLAALSFSDSNISNRERKYVCLESGRWVKKSRRKGVHFNDYSVLGSGGLCVLVCFSTLTSAAAGPSCVS